MELAGGLVRSGPLCFGAPRRGPALWRISGHRPTPVPACASVGIRVCLCVSALPTLMLLSICAPVSLCTYNFVFVWPCDFPSCECLCVVCISADLLLLLCHASAHLCMCPCVCVTMKMPAPLCVPRAPVMSLVEFFLYVSPSYLCVSVCPQVPELFCVAQGFCVCGFVFCVFLGAFVCLYPRAWVCGCRVLFTHPSSSCLYPVWEILGLELRVWA